MIKRIIHIVLVLGFTKGVVAQSTLVPLSNGFDFATQKIMARLNASFHPGMRPYLLSDSLRKEQFELRQALGDKLLKNDYTVNSGNHWINSWPIGGMIYEKHKHLGRDTIAMNFAGGIALEYRFKDKFSVTGDFVASKGTYTPYLLQQLDTVDIMAGNGWRYNGTPGKIYYENWSAVASFSPNRFINLQLGKGKQFWGSGYRSLFLSDNATNYPFLKFTADFWRIKYVSLVSMMADVRYAYGDRSKAVTKYSTSHYLSWNITKRINLNIFESVVWQAKDTLQNRQLDIHYLNPVIFYRPVEYSLGSSDNSILGLGLNVKADDYISFYFQGLLDEFVLDQIKADSGWWANKFAIQIGIKAFDPFKLKGLYVQTEYNVARPFTWSHGSVYQNYAHFNQPLAHPMGSNFREWVTILKYNYKWITLSNKTIIANYGTDTSGLNFGGNLYQDYISRYQDYHNFIGQGLNNELFMNTTMIELHLMKQNNLNFEIGYTTRKITNTNGTQDFSFIFIGLRANIANFYNDF